MSVEKKDAATFLKKAKNIKAKLTRELHMKGKKDQTKPETDKKPGKATIDTGGISTQRVIEVIENLINAAIVVQKYKGKEKIKLSIT